MEMEPAVTVERVPGGYIVQRRFESLSAAMAAVDALLEVCESAYRTPVRQDTGD